MKTQLKQHISRRIDCTGETITRIEYEHDCYGADRLDLSGADGFVIKTTDDNSTETVIRCWIGQQAFHDALSTMLASYGCATDYHRNKLAELIGFAQTRLDNIDHTINAELAKLEVAA